MNRPGLVAALLLTAVGCTAGPGPAAGPVPALRTDDTEAGRVELEAAAARLVGAARLDLAADAFRAAPEIAVERRRRRSLDGEMDSLDLSAPNRLRLEQEDGACRLLHLGTLEVAPLSAVVCRPVTD